MLPTKRTMTGSAWSSATRFYKGGNANFSCSLQTLSIVLSSRQKHAILLLQSANTFYALLSAKHCCGPTLSAGQRGKLRRQVDIFLTLSEKLKHISIAHLQGPWRLVRVNSTTGVSTRHLARAVVALRSVRDQTMVLWTDPVRQGWRSRQPVSFSKNMLFGRAKNSSQ